MFERDFVAYEYKTVSVKAKDQAKTMDVYEAFGWEVTSAAQTLDGHAVLFLKRDRKQRHRTELTKLERQAEDTLDALRTLERSKTLGATVFSSIFGCIGALVLGGGMALVMQVGGVPAMAGGIVLGLVGIVICAVNYPIFKKMAAKKTKSLLPVIDQTEEKLALLLEKGNDLLSTEQI